VIPTPRTPATKQRPTVLFENEGLDTVGYVTSWCRRSTTCWFCQPTLPKPPGRHFTQHGAAGGAQDGGVISPTSFSGPWKLRAPQPPAPANGPDRDVDADTACVTKGRTFAVIRQAGQRQPSKPTHRGALPTPGRLAAPGLRLVRSKRGPEETT